MRAFISSDPELNGVVIAPLWRRTVAWAIDCFLVLSVELVIALISLAIYATVDYLDTGKWTLEYDAKAINPSPAFLLSLLILPYVLYHVLLIRLWKGHTPGKNFMQVRVLAKRSAEVSCLRSIARVVLQPISVLTGFLGYLGFLRSRKNSSLHDWISGTIVLREEVEHRIIHGTVAPKPISVHQ
jgi:uncharacterized RDD family membrane protein YckC